MFYDGGAVVWADRVLKVRLTHLLRSKLESVIVADL